MEVFGYLPESKGKKVLGSAPGEQHSPNSNYSFSDSSLDHRREIAWLRLH